MSTAAYLMSKLMQFPRDMEPEDDRPHGSTMYVSVAFAGILALMSVGAAVLTGGIMMGRVEESITRLTESWNRDHDEVYRQLYAIQGTLGALSVHSASLDSQLAALKQALDLERQERIRSTERMDGRIRP